ncbi:MAG: DUF5034 domain-containing protein [Bacteroidales bacterium]|nr:DUF5034 domain-containing protein [Bacteroidales bacterium]
MKKVGYVIIAVFLMKIVISCCSNEEPIDYFYNYQSPKLYNLDISGKAAVISLNDTIPINDFGLMFEFEVSQMAILNNNATSLFCKAYAYDCYYEPEQYSAGDSIISIQMISNGHINDDYPKGSDVTDLYYAKGRSFKKLKQFVQKPDVIYYDKPLFETWEVKCQYAEIMEGWHSFHVAVQLSNGKVMKATSPKVYLTTINN